MTIDDAQTADLKREEMLRVAFAAVRLYAETHPRPSYVNKVQAAQMLEISGPTLSKLIRFGVIRQDSRGRIPITEIDRALQPCDGPPGR